MATITATILVGTEHRFGGGIEPSHILLLSETDRAAWSVVPLNESSNESAFSRWIPNAPETILADGLLLIATRILKSPEIIRDATSAIPGMEDPFVDLTVTKATVLSPLYEQCRHLDVDYKLLITVTSESSIKDQLRTLRDHTMDLVVCSPSYERWRPTFGDGTQERGSL